MVKKDRKQINVRLERELYDFLVKYSENNYKTVTGTLRELIADLYKAHNERIVVDEQNNIVPVLTKKYDGYGN